MVLKYYLRVFQHKHSPAIYISMKRILLHDSSESDILCDDMLDIILFSNQSCKQIYKKLVKKITSIPTCQITWPQEFLCNNVNKGYMATYIQTYISNNKQHLKKFSIETASQMFT